MYAAIKFFLFTLFGSALMIVSFLALYFLAGRQAPSTSTMLADSARRGIAHDHPAAGSSAACSSGFGIKVPMFPFHTWLPDAHTQAPTVRAR